MKIFCSGVLSTPKLIDVRIEGNGKFKKKGDGDLDLNATIKEVWKGGKQMLKKDGYWMHWKALMETYNQKFAEKVRGCKLIYFHCHMSSC